MTTPDAVPSTAALLGVGAAFDGRRLVPGDVAGGPGRVVALGVASGSGDLVAAPGFVDLQLNGFRGVDLLTAGVEEHLRVAHALPATGVTAFQPTLITAPPEVTVRALHTVADAARHAGGARVLPAHLEGPFLSPRWPGAHPVELLRNPEPDLLDTLLAAGPVGQVTLAPELPGALDAVAALAAAGVTVAVGHSDATAEQSHAAFDAGARALTHAFNAHRRLTGRDPGPAGAALARDDVFVAVLADGVHLAPETLALVHRAASQRLVAVTDAMTAAGLGDGVFTFGSLTVRVAGGRATLADGTLAGSVATLDACVRGLVAAGVPVESALASVTSRPAALLGRPDLGTLEVGAVADLVVLDPELRPVRTLVAGVPVFDAAPPAPTAAR